MKQVFGIFILLLVSCTEEVKLQEKELQAADTTKSSSYGSIDKNAEEYEVTDQDDSNNQDNSNSEEDSDNQDTTENQGNPSNLEKKHLIGELLKWNSIKLSDKRNTTRVSFDIAVKGTNVDGLIGLSDNTVRDYSHMAVIIRLNKSGQIDARDGSAYSKNVNIDYNKGETFKINIELDFEQKRYHAFITDRVGNKAQLAKFYKFRDNFNSSDNSISTYIATITHLGASQGFNISNLKVENDIDFEKYVKAEEPNDNNSDESNGTDVVIDDDYSTGGSPADTKTVKSATIDGVTFNFKEASKVGNFISGGNGAGDLFVVGPVTLNSYTPGSKKIGNGRIVNGAMLNPVIRNSVGFDSITSKHYVDSLNVGKKLPLKLYPGDSLIVAVSDESATKVKNSIKRFAVLTCVEKVPSSDSFRPHYSKGNKKIYNLGQVEFKKLPRLTSIGRAPDNIVSLTKKFKRFAIDLVPNWDRDHIQTRGHPPVYGRDLLAAWSDPLTLLLSNYDISVKKPIAISLIQEGIDRYGLYKEARSRGVRPWQADGGHNAGRKFSMIAAGHLLGDEGLMSIGQEGIFQEDTMSIYVTKELVNITQGKGLVAWKPAYENKYKMLPYTDGMIGMPEWRGKNNLKSMSAHFNGHAYRRSPNGGVQHAQVLALISMNLESKWNHPAYFDFHMRYISVMSGNDDPWRFKGGNKALYGKVFNATYPGWELHWHNPWPYDMLQQYKHNFYKYPWGN